MAIRTPIYNNAGVPTNLKAGTDTIIGPAASGLIGSLAAIANAAGVTLTAAQIYGGVISRSAAASVTDTTDTAANIIAAIPGAVVGTVIDLTIQNSNSGVLTIGAGAGVTLSGTTQVSPGFAREYFAIVTNVAAPAVAIVGLYQAAIGLGGSTTFNQGGNAFAATGVLGTADANLLNIVTNNVARFQVDSATATFTGQGPTVFDSLGTNSLGFGSNAVAKTITIGNQTGASSVVIQAGTGNVYLRAPTGGNVIIGDSAQTNIAIGTSANAQTINIGNTTINTNVSVNCGPTGFLNIGTAASAQPITIGNTTGATSVAVNCGTGGINIGSTAFAKTINIDQGATGGTINLGGTGSTTNVTGAFGVGPTAPGTIKCRFSRADGATLSGNYSYHNGTAALGITTAPNGYWGMEVDNRIACHGEIDVNSDRRAKTHNGVMNPADASAMVMKVPTVMYQWNDGRADTSPKIGFYSQDVGNAGLGEAVVAIPQTTPDGRVWSDFHFLDKDTMLAVLWAANQDLVQRIERLEGKTITLVAEPITLEAALAEGKPIN